jgi:hypothetical protein
MNIKEKDPYEVLQVKFNELTHKLHDICNENPKILAGLFFELVDVPSQDEEDYMQDEKDYITDSIKTIEKIEQLIDAMQERSKAIIQ